VQFVVIATSSLWGSASDKIGRRWIYCASFVIISFAYYLTPLAPSILVLILFRLVFAFGAAGASAMLTAGTFVSACFTLYLSA
jgi:MFS family permease